jgi:hypothetical protein
MEVAGAPSFGNKTVSRNLFPLYANLHVTRAFSKERSQELTFCGAKPALAFYPLVKAAKSSEAARFVSNDIWNGAPSLKH